MKKRRILMLLGNNPYPFDTRVRPEAVALAENGFDVTVISPKLRSQSLYEVVDGVRAYRYPAPPEIDSVLGYVLEFGYSLVASFIITIYVFLRHGFDVIHSHNPPDTFVLISKLFGLFGKKYVFDHHDLSCDLYRARGEDEGNAFLYNVLYWFEQQTVRHADMIISTNDSYKRIISRRHRVPADKFVVVRNGPDLNRLQQVAPDPMLRSMNKHIIGFVGSMGKQDGLDYLLRSLHHLRYTMNRNDFYAVLVGGGGEFEFLQELTKDLDLEDHVCFTGMQDGEVLNRYFSSMDICVDPDPSNSFNDHSTMIKMMEYMTFGKPIVAFDLPEHRVSAGEAAVYVRSNNVPKFAQAMAKLMDDPALCEQMGRYGRNRIENELNWEYSLKKLVSAYDRFFRNERPAQVPDVVRSR